LEHFHLLSFFTNKEKIDFSNILEGIAKREVNKISGTGREHLL
jgi:hypothetical protein